MKKLVWIKKTTQNIRLGLQGLLIILSFNFLVACRDNGSAPSECSEPFSETVEPIQIKGGHHIYFDIEAFKFLKDPNIVIENIELVGQIDSKKKKDHDEDGHKHQNDKDHKDSENDSKNHDDDSDDKIEDFSISVNGIKASRRDGGRLLELQHKKFSCRAHKFFLNGGEPFHKFMAKIKKHKGVLVLSVHSKHRKVIEAHLVITGRRYVKCDTPPPPPPPPAVPPHTTIDAVNPAGPLVNSSNISFSFSADQSNVNFSCALDGAAPTTCSSPMIYTGLTNGSHTFSVFATNASGLSDTTPPSYSWTIDTIAPTVSIDNLASLPTLTSNTSMTVLFSSSEPGTFTCSVDGAAPIACTSPLNLSGLSEGTHSISIDVIDSAGNPSLNPAFFQWTIDLTAPIASIHTVTPSALINNSSVMTFEFAANESANFECSLDNNTYLACTSPLSVQNIVEGNHWFSVRAIDAAGNVGLPASYSWTTDFTAPTMSLGNVVPAPGLTNSDNLFVEFIVSEPSTVSCNLDGVITTCTSPLTTVVTEGPHQLILLATDSAGNQSDPISLAWTVDRTSPTLSWGAILPSAANFINSSSLSLEVIASENVSFTSKLNGTDIGQTTSPITLTGLTDGNYLVEVTGMDAAGNLSTSISHRFTVDTLAPVVSASSSVGTITNLDSNSISFSANETVEFSCNINQTGYTSCVSPLNLSGLADGEHSVVITAKDLAGNISAPVSVVWTVDTLPPITSLSVTQNSYESFTFVSSSNETGSRFICSIDNGAFQACDSTTTMTFTAGSHSFVVRAVDAAGNMDPEGASYIFTVSSPVVTKIDSASSTTLTNLSTQTIRFSSNYTNATFQCALDNALMAPCTSPVTYNGLSDGAHTFTVQAIDPWGNVDPVGASVSWSIDTVVPIVSNITYTSSSTTATVTWATNEMATSKLHWGITPDTSNVVADDGVFKTSHSVRLVGLKPNTGYSVRPAGHDLAGNAYLAGPFTIRTGR